MQITRNRKSVKKSATAKPVIVCMVHVEDKGYFVLAHRDEPAVRGFPTKQDGLDFFEKAYAAALDRGMGWSAGAVLHTIQLRPRILTFASIDALRDVVGKRVHLATINGTGVHERAFRCADQKRAARAYGKGAVPRLARQGVAE